MERRVWKFVLIVVGVILAPIAARAESPDVIEVGKFSSGMVGQVVPEGWKPLTFKKILKQTVYELVKDGDAVVVKAVSDASASGLIKVVNLDPKEYPIVRWRWKVENILKHNDVTRKDGDDFPARIYITFAYDSDKVSFGKKLKFKAGQAIFGNIPIGALNYIWDTHAPVGTIVRDPRRQRSGRRHLAPALRLTPALHPGSVRRPARWTLPGEGVRVAHEG